MLGLPVLIVHCKFRFWRHGVKLLALKPIQVITRGEWDEIKIHEGT
ncbi:hypothetical protein AVDCRST_MAG94-596 [uncultured Leptolyngbya sp.]|uniref:Uncharacterized protein n=1 Tax=uncultured Leptolyngbya sp. TaxID=332963 RepID=A0A6J4KFJ4_9CYAN|nr:hypothetical protein AVDCRST_MAG94-596 [uncultured Leptolyngbya sp.]